MLPLRTIVIPLVLMGLSTTSAAQANTAAKNAAPARDSLAITFLANEGVMVSSGGTTVLIDALFGDGLRGYGVVTPATRTLLESARPPFDRVNAVLATHRHDDHFNAQAVLRHLVSNPAATFISTTEAVGLVRAADSATTRTMTSRLVAATPPPGQRVRVATLAGATIYALGLPHSPKHTPQNVGFVIDIGGRRVLHVGDSETDVADFTGLDLDELGIDVALLPPWYLRSASMREVIRREIKPGAIGVIHLQVGMLDRLRGREPAEVREIRTAFPNAHAFSRELDTWVIR